MVAVVTNADGLAARVAAAAARPGTGAESIQRIIVNQRGITRRAAHLHIDAVLCARP